MQANRQCWFHIGFLRKRGKRILQREILRKKDSEGVWNISIRLKSRGRVVQLHCRTKVSYYCKLRKRPLDLGSQSWDAKAHAIVGVIKLIIINVIF